jgi:hypothetical protein
MIENDSLNKPKQVIIDLGAQVKDSIQFYKSNLYKSTMADSSKKVELKNISEKNNQYIKNDTSNLLLMYKNFIFEPWESSLKTTNLINKQFYIKEKIFNNFIPIKSSARIIFENTRWPNKNINSINDAIIFLILVSFVLLAWVKISYGKYLNQLLRSLVNYSEEAKLFRDQNAMINRLYFVLNIIFTITGGLFIFYAVNYINGKILLKSPFLILIGGMGIIIIIYLYKYFINKTFGFVIYKNQVFKEYLHSTFIFYKALGMFLLPLSFVLFVLTDHYRIWVLVICVLLIFMLYFTSIFRATRIMLQKGILLFYWILYLCIVEFLPIILLCKFLNCEL